MTSHLPQLGEEYDPRSVEKVERLVELLGMEVGFRSTTTRSRTRSHSDRSIGRSSSDSRVVKRMLSGTCIPCWPWESGRQWMISSRVPAP